MIQTISQSPMVRMALLALKIAPDNEARPTQDGLRPACRAFLSQLASNKEGADKHEHDPSGQTKYYQGIGISMPSRDLRVGPGMASPRYQRTFW